MVSDKKNVLFISDFAANFPGAFFNSLEKLAEAVKDDGGKCTFIFPEYRPFFDGLSGLGKVHTISSFSGKKFDPGLVLLVSMLIRKERINIIHTNFGLGPYIAASIVAFFYRVKVVSHERNPSSNYGKRINPLKSFFIKTFFGLLNLTGRTTHIAISRGVKDSLVQYNGITEKRIEVINNAVEITDNPFRELPGYSWIKEGKKDSFTIGMTAHFGPQKDHLTVVKAVNLLKKQGRKVFCILIGGNVSNYNPEDYKANIITTVKELCLEDNFFFAGELEDPLPLVSLFNVGLLISNWEGFGNALVEYMLLKKPVIGTNVGGIPDIIDDDIGFIIPRGNHKQLAEKISFFMYNADLMETFGENAFNKAEATYNIKRWIGRVMDIYNEMIA